MFRYDKGIEVTPKLLEWLNENGYSDNIKQLIEARRLYGLKKYGQSLMTEDGRNTLEDARQEAGDLLQYLYKAVLQESRLNADELKKFREILSACSTLLDML